MQQLQRLLHPGSLPWRWLSRKKLGSVQGVALNFSTLTSARRDLYLQTWLRTEFNQWFELGAAQDLSVKSYASDATACATRTSFQTTHCAWRPMVPQSCALTIFETCSDLSHGNAVSLYASLTYLISMGRSSPTCATSSAAPTRSFWSQTKLTCCHVRCNQTPLIGGFELSVRGRAYQNCTR